MCVCVFTYLGISGEVLHNLKNDEYFAGVIVAWVSSCDEPEWARECLEKFRTPHNEALTHCAHVSHIFKDDKRVHFLMIKAAYPHLAYSEMIFFDNQMNNIEAVRQLGVHCVYCPQGITSDIWTSGLKAFGSL